MTDQEITKEAERRRRQLERDMGVIPLLSKSGPYVMRGVVQWISEGYR